MGRCHRIPLAALFVAAVFGSYGTRAAEMTHTGQSIIPFTQSFFFDWTTAGSPVPIVEQCGVLDITWARGAATGPSPSAPYYLQIYTSTFILPLVLDVGSAQEYQWPVPFTPNTTFQICMFDKNGNTGGCQRTMTVITNYNDSTPTCQNLTYPQPSQQLEVDAFDSIGPLSQYGWPSQCTDLSFTPKNGSAPYTLTIAPTLHPPYNITVNSTGTTANWTIDQTWGSSFFVSVADSAGNGWAYGPLHSGEGEDNCLGSGSSQKKQDNTVSTYVAVGAGVGGAVGGLLLGLVSAFFLYRYARPQGPRVTVHNPSRESVLMSGGPEIDTVYTALPHFGGHTRTGSTASQTIGVNSVGGRQQHEAWKIEPWVPPGERGPSPPTSPNQRHDAPPVGAAGAVQPPSPPQTATSLSTSPPPSQPRQGSAVYVVHHDGGRPPVSVYAEDGTEIVELPPRYVGGNNNTQPAGTSERPPIVQRRQPNAPSKGRTRTIENPSSPVNDRYPPHP